MKFDVGGMELGMRGIRKLSEHPESSPFGKVPLKLRYPQPLPEPSDPRLQRVGDAVWEYWVRTRSFPATNVELVKELRKAGIYDFAKEELNERGEAIDPWGNQYVYASPGNLSPEFDLYSIGPNARDEQGRGDDIVYLTEIM